jgi:SpoVK/Ycf46/Vps4 family AAA+-type ATPase
MIIDTSGNYPFPNKIDLLVGLGDQLMTRHRNALDLFSSAFVKAPKSRLQLSHYPHVSKDIEILCPYLMEALGSCRKGVNILIHGKPGTGKTELVRTLSNTFAADLYEVATQTREGGPIEGDDRFRGYQLAQAVLGRSSNHLVFFDEIEDVFRPRDESRRTSISNASGMKGWVNKILEENLVPTFWVTNHLHILDQAFIRRFDFVLHLDNPPRSVRRRILEDYVKGLPVDDVTKNRLAEHENLSPAIISRAAAVVRTAGPALGCQSEGSRLSQVIGNTLEALGHSRTARQALEVVTEYRPEIVNTDSDLGPILAGLREHGAGRICFYGPPGTGKTAYGRHLAEQLDRPLMVKRGSDLISMWVGETEKNFAKMFEEARSERAVLLLDEADSFLQDRSNAQRSWEVTEVNEMLTQMEAFEGTFIASTNLIDKLDPAALRRFDLKVKFDYLRPEQAWVMFQDTACKLGLGVDPVIKGALDLLSVLTPGDFAAVIRQARLRHPGSARDLLERLEAECQVKPEFRRKPIGFLRRASTL